MGAARSEVPVAQFHRKPLGHPAPQQRGLGMAVFVEIDVGVVTLDGGVRPRRRGQHLLARPHAGRPGRGLRRGGMAPRALAGLRRIDGRQHAFAVEHRRMHRQCPRCTRRRTSSQCRRRTSANQTAAQQQATPRRREQIGPGQVLLRAVGRCGTRGVGISNTHRQSQSWRQSTMLRGQRQPAPMAAGDMQITQAPGRRPRKRFPAGIRNGFLTHAGWHC